MGDWDRSSVLGTRRGIISQPQGRKHAALAAAAVRRFWNSYRWREEDEQGLGRLVLLLYVVVNVGEDWLEIGAVEVKVSWKIGWAAM
ncbi:hypothetical protein KY289_008611 [Solanum tuberosum]|nr:hypothetical protein KY289_008611 [Solanum tuberosum]